MDFSLNGVNNVNSKEFDKKNKADNTKQDKKDLLKFEDSSANNLTELEDEYSYLAGLIDTVDDSDAKVIQAELDRLTDEHELVLGHREEQKQRDVLIGKVEEMDVPDEIKEKLITSLYASNDFEREQIEAEIMSLAYKNGLSEEQFGALKDFRNTLDDFEYENKQRELEIKLKYADELETEQIQLQMQVLYNEHQINLEKRNRAE